MDGIPNVVNVFPVLYLISSSVFAVFFPTSAVFIHIEVGL